MALALGASGVWVGTRFVAAKEASAAPRFQQAIVKAEHADTVQTLIYSGRPMRVLRTPYVDNWEKKRASEIVKLTSAGEVPHYHEMDEIKKSGKEPTAEQMIEQAPLISELITFLSGKRMPLQLDLFLSQSGSSCRKHPGCAASERYCEQDDGRVHRVDQEVERRRREAVNSEETE
jgi:hypothetical protein